MKILSIFIFEMKISVWNLKKMAISPEGNEKIEMKKIIYFIYATEINFQ
jgi:uncharacterized membrane protein YccF (DUF307 family)